MRAHRSAVAHARPLPLSVAPAMAPVLAKAIARLVDTFPPVSACLAAAAANKDGKTSTGMLSGIAGRPPSASVTAIFDSEEDEEDDEEEVGNSINGMGPMATTSSRALLGPSSWVQRPRLLLCGPEGAGQQHLGPALLYALEGLPVHAVGLPSLLSDPGWVRVSVLKNVEDGLGGMDVTHSLKACIAFAPVASSLTSIREHD